MLLSLIHYQSFVFRVLYQIYGHGQVESLRMKKEIHLAHIVENKVKVASLILDKVDFRSKKTDRKGHYQMIKWSTYPKD